MAASQNMIIRYATLSDAGDIADIYNHYIAHSTATFEEDLVDAAEIAQRIADLTQQRLPWFVADDGGERCIGYAYASKWKGRCAYRHSVEVTVYLSPHHTGMGTGTLLYKALFAELKALGYHAAMGGIALPNPQSIKLHEKLGMAKAAHFREVGYKFGKWIDVGYWQCILDRAE